MSKYTSQILMESIFPLMSFTMMRESTPAKRNCMPR